MKVRTCGGMFALAMLAVLSTASVAGPLMFGSPTSSPLVDESPSGDELYGISGSSFDDVGSSGSPDAGPAQARAQGGNVTLDAQDPPAHPVPEPHSMWLLGSSMLGLAGFRMIRQRRV